MSRFQTWEDMDDNRARAFLAAVETAKLFEDGSWMQIGIDRHGLLIGDMGICLTGDTVELGITLHPDLQGQGFAREAWEGAMTLIWTHTSARRVLGITDARNTASRRMLMAAGLAETAQEAAVYDGEACIDVTYTALRPKGASRE